MTSVINIVLAYNVLKFCSTLCGFPAFNRLLHCFEIYYMKNSISYRGSIVWNLLEPSAVSARDYAKRAKNSHALRNLNFNEDSQQMSRPQIDSDFVFYCFYSYLLLHICHLLLTTFNFNYFILLTFFTRPHKLLSISFKTHRV